MEGYCYLLGRADVGNFNKLFVLEFFFICLKCICAVSDNVV